MDDGATFSMISSGMIENLRSAEPARVSGAVALVAVRNSIGENYPGVECDGEDMPLSEGVRRQPVQRSRHEKFDSADILRVFQKYFWKVPGIQKV